MNEFYFLKISATGNDFVLIDNRDKIISHKNVNLWSKICNRQNGVGCDGVILLEKSEKYDFKMVYINADGGEVEMCGNGARAISRFAEYLKIGNGCEYVFETKNGVYSSLVSPQFIKVYMNELYDVGTIRVEDFFEEDENILSSTYLNTGVPHVVFEVQDLSKIPISEYGKRVRHDPRFIQGTNVDFVQKIDSSTLKVRTFERGVEAETLSCGTGVVASAIFHYINEGAFNSKKILVAGGELKVEILKDPLSSDGPKNNITLGGPAEIIFKGQFFSSFLQNVYPSS